MVLSMIVASMVIYCCYVFSQNVKTKGDCYKRYTLHEKFVLDNETGEVYYISTSYPPKKVFDPSLLK